MCNYNEVMKELAEYKRIKEQAETMIDGLTDELKQYMTENNIDTLQGDEHKAIYKVISSTRFDSKAFKLDNPQVYEKYSKTSESMRFTFN